MPAAPGQRWCWWLCRGAVPFAGRVQRSWHSWGQHLCQPGQLESLAQSGRSWRGQRVKSRGHLPGFWGSPAVGRWCQGSTGQHQAAEPLVFCPQGAGRGSPLQGTGDRSGERSVGGQDLGRSSASWGPGSHSLARQCLADGNAGAARQSLECRQSCCRGRRGTGWSVAGDSPATRPWDCHTPTLRPARHSVARHGAVCALTRQRVPQGALLALPGRSHH